MGTAAAGLRTQGGVSASWTALWIALGTFGVCTCVAVCASTFLLSPEWSSGAADFPQNPLTRAWIHGDAVWYSNIASQGYWYTPGRQGPIAFFPMYPLTVRALYWLGVNRFFAGIFVTAMCGLGAVWLFSRWAARLVDERTALFATAFFALYPFALFLYGAMYSDALFALLVIGAFLCIETDRTWGALLLGALATAARPVAPAVVLGLVARHLERRWRAGQKIRAVDLLPAGAAIGLLLWMGFLAWRFGDPLAFVHVQSAPGWDQGVGWHSWLKLTALERFAHLQDLWTGRDSGASLLQRFLHHPERDFVLRTLVHGAVAFASLALAIPLWRRVSRGYALYVLVVVGIPALSTKDFMGLGRYGLAAFPVFVALAILLRGRPRTRWAYLTLTTAGLLLLTLGYATDQYVS